jgi:tetratricopeptide (TPR) repeat protein
MQPSEAELVLLHTCADNAEATALRMLLDAHGIPVFIQGENHRQLVGMFGTYIELRALVRAEDLERAQALLKQADSDAPTSEPDAPDALPEETPDPDETRPMNRKRWLRAVALSLLLGPVLMALIALVSLWLPSTERTWSHHIREGDEAFEARAYPESEAAYRLADATARAFPAPDERLGDTWVRLGAVLLAQNRPADAEPVLRQALDFRQRLFGVNGPALTEPLLLLARLHQQQGRLGEAEAELRHIVQIAQKDPAQQPRLGQVLGMLGGVYQERGDLEGAALALEQSAELMGQLQGAQDADTALALARLAEVRMAMHLNEQALELYSRALPVLEKAHGESAPDVLSIAFSLGTLHAPGAGGGPLPPRAGAPRARPGRAVRRAHAPGPGHLRQAPGGALQQPARAAGGLCRGAQRAPAPRRGRPGGGPPARAVLRAALKPFTPG